MRLLRLIISSFWKLYVGVAFTVTLLVFFPVFYVLLSNKKWKKFTFALNVFWSRLMRILCFYAVDVKGENDQELPSIICANHTSYLDIFLMYSILPNAKFLFMGKAELLRYPLVSLFFKRLNIPVFRKDRLKAARSFIQAKNEINEGWSFVIFPEGGIPDENPKMLPFKEGAFKLAKACKVGIMPITFVNNFKLFSDPENIWGTAYPGLVKIVLHKFVFYEEIEELSTDELSKFIFNTISSGFNQKID